MTNDTLVSINVVDQKNNILLNNTLVPILYYWNGEGDLIKNIINDKSFRSQYITSIKTYEEYINRSIYYFFFKFNEDTGDEEYTDKSFKISELISFSDLNDSMVLSLLSEKMKELYKTSLHKDFSNNSFDDVTIIKEIYKELKSLYGDRVQILTLVNYIRSKLTENGLNSENSYYTINLLKEILDESKM